MKLKEIKWQAWVVITFVVLFVWGAHAYLQTADAAEVRIGLAGGVANTKGGIAQDLMLLSNKRDWYVQATRIGQVRMADRETRRERFNSVNRISAGYRVNWRRETRVSPYMRLGMAYWTRDPWPYISDDLAYDMAIGIRFYNIVELEYQHNSTAGRTDHNLGVDFVCLCLVLPL